MRPSRWGSTVVAVTAVMVLAAACQDEVDDPVGLPGGGQPTPGGTPGGVEPTVSPRPADVDDDVEDVDVVTRNFAFDPAQIEVQQGGELEIENRDATIEHTFTIEGEAIDEVIRRGEDIDVRIDLEPGTYDVICRFHESRGMAATLEVT